MVAIHLSETLVNIHNSPDHLNFSPRFHRTVHKWPHTEPAETSPCISSQLIKLWSTSKTVSPNHHAHYKLQTSHRNLGQGQHYSCTFAASPMQDKHLPWPITTWHKTAELLLHHPALYKVIISPCKLHIPLIPLCDLITSWWTAQIMKLPITWFSPILKLIITEGNMLWTITKQHTMKTYGEVVGFMPHLPYLQGNSFQ